MVLGVRRASLAALVTLLVAAAAPATGERLDRITIKSVVISNEAVGAQRLIVLEGTGHSSSLGAIDSTSSVVVTPGPGCYPRTAESVWSTGAGTLTVQEEAQVCNSGISGTWTVTGGTGAFAGASGGGSLSGSGSTTQINVRYAGDISS